MKKTLTIALCVLLFSCTKKFIDSPQPNPNTATTVRGLTGGPTYPLDWENISQMPTPTGVDPIPTPWQSGLSGAKINPDILFDYAKSDGWELVYNTFNTTTPPPSNYYYFILYNKYRGVLRLYFYFAPGQNYPSDNLVPQLIVKGPAAPNSPILNFAGTDMVNFGTNNPAATDLLPYQVSSTPSWYASEFELAYDPNITTPTDSYQNLQMEWQINPNSIAQISLNGNERGSLDGTITVPSSKTNFFGTLVNTLVTAGVTVGASEATGGLDFLVSTGSDGKKDNSLQKSVASAITNGLSGSISGFLNGIFGFTKKSSTTQKVSLTINTQITVDGTSTVHSQMYDNSFMIPGTQNSDPLIYEPIYPKALGVFYISAKPTVNVKQTIYNIHRPADIGGARNKFNFTLTSSSFSLLFNPAVTAIANISNIRYEILTTPASFQLDRLSSEMSIETIANKEYWGPIYLVFDEPRIVNPFGLVYPVYVRVSFDVVPKDGSPKSTIVKTFSANVTHS